MLKQSLHENWTVRATSNLSEVPSNIRDANIPAQVPGCVHTDLLRLGLIEDPYFGLNEPKLLWIGRTDWQYRTTFDTDAKLFDQERIDLVCDGLDTIAKIELNGALVGETINMHRGYRFDVRKHLKKGRNELVITFTSPVHYANAMHEKLGHYPATTQGANFNYIRKMACNYGWDWGPIVPTSGIWRAIRLEAWNTARIQSVLPHVLKLDSKCALLRVDVQIEGKSQPNISIKTPDGQSLKFQGNEIEIRNPQIWWPAGHG